MPKVLIIDSTIVNFHDEKGGQHVEQAEIVNPPKGVAADLVAAGRALYVSKDDDPTKGNLNTASPAMLAAAEKMRAQRSPAPAAAKGGKKAATTKTPVGGDGGGDDTGGDGSGGEDGAGGEDGGA